MTADTSNHINAGAFVRAEFDAGREVNTYDLGERCFSGDTDAAKRALRGLVRAGIAEPTEPGATDQSHYRRKSC